LTRWSIIAFSRAYRLWICLGDVVAIRILPDPLRHSLHFHLGQIRRLDWKGRPFHRGYRKRPRRLLNRLRPLRFLSYRRVAWRLRLSGLTSHCSTTPCTRPDETFHNERPPRNTEHQPGLSGGGPYEVTLRARNYLPSEILDYALSCRCQVIGNSEFFGGVMLSTILLLG
jgi:hypothetical protein